MKILKEIWESLEMLKDGFIFKVIGAFVLTIIFGLIIQKC